MLEDFQDQRTSLSPVLSGASVTLFSSRGNHFRFPSRILPSSCLPGSSRRQGTFRPELAWVRSRRPAKVLRPLVLPEVCHPPGVPDLHPTAATTLAPSGSLSHSSLRWSHLLWSGKPIMFGSTPGSCPSVPKIASRLHPGPNKPLVLTKKSHPTGSGAVSPKGLNPRLTKRSRSDPARRLSTKVY